MATYTIKSGDTLSKIAQQNGTTVGALAQLNGITDVNKIFAGQSLNIGGASVPTAPVAVTPTPAKTPVLSTYDSNAYRSTVSNLTANSTPAYIAPKTNLTYNTPAPVTPAPIVTPTPTKTTTPTPQATVTPPAGGGDGSIVNLLASRGIDSSYANRAKLALANGIQNYTGTAQQNTALYGILSKQGTGGAPATNANPTGGNMSPAQNVNPDGTPMTPAQIQEKATVDLATKAGQAGLSVTEYQALMASQNAPTREETAQIEKELGITALEGQAFAKPSQSSQQLYEQAYNTSGLSDLKKKISELNDSINKDRADLTDAIGTIDENPFLTEASRVGRGKRALDQAESRINNKLAQVEQLQKVYDGGVTEINSMVTRNQTDFGQNQQRDQAQLAYLQAKAEKEAGQLSSEKGLAGTSAYLGSRADSKAPDTIGNDSTGYFRWDGTLKKFVQVIAPSAKNALELENQRLQNTKLRNDINNPNGGDNAFKPTADQKALVGRFLNTADGKALYSGQQLTSADITAINADPALFYAMLQKANEAGIY